MPADFRPYIDLTVNDVSPTDVYLAAENYARQVLPDFELRQGTVEDAMFQALSYIQMLSVGSINRLPNRLMEGTLRLLGLGRSEGSRATLVATVTLNEVINFVLPAGTAVTYEAQIDIDGDPIAYTFRNVEPLTILATDIPSGQTYPSKTVTLVCDTVGTILDPDPGQELVLQKIFTDVETVIFTGSFENGQPPESDAEYLSRGSSYIRSLSSGLTTAQQVEEYVLNNFGDVRRCVVADTTDTGTLAVGSAASPGNMVIFVYGVNGNLSGGEKTDITQEITNLAVAGLVIATEDFQVSPLSVSMTMRVDDDAIEQNVVNAVKKILRAYLNPYRYSATKPGVYINDVGYEVANVEGVAIVESLTLSQPASEYTVSGGNLIFKRKGQMPTIEDANITITVLS